MSLLEPHYVYLIGHRAGDSHSGPVKVGYTKHPAARLSSLQTGNPTALSIIFKLRAPSRELARAAEAAFHEVAKAQRLGGEWFDMSPELGLNTLTKCFMALIADGVDDIGQLSDLLKWSGVIDAAAAWQAMAQEQS